MLANSLKIILSCIISITLSVFVLGCLITDNVLVAYEIMHFLRNKRTGMEGFISLKLDIAKHMIGWNEIFWRNSWRNWALGLCGEISVLLDPD